MDEFDTPLVSAYALVGHDERLLVLTDRLHAVHALPGGAVRAGEPIEHALRRMVRNQLDMTIAHLGFYGAIEHPVIELGHRPTSEVAILFVVPE